MSHTHKLTANHPWLLLLTDHQNPLRVCLLLIFRPTWWLCRAHHTCLYPPKLETCSSSPCSFLCFHKLQLFIPYNSNQKQILSGRNIFLSFANCNSIKPGSMCVTTFIWTRNCIFLITTLPLSYLQYHIFHIYSWILLTKNILLHFDRIGKPSW